MKSFISLNKNIDCNIVCEKTKSLIDNYIKSGNDISKTVLVISITEIATETYENIPKLEHKNE